MPDSELVLLAGRMDIHRVMAGRSREELQAVTFRQGKADSLIIQLPRRFQPDEHFWIAIAYTAHPDRGLYFLHASPDWPARKEQIWTQGEPEDNHYWFPVFDYPSDKLTTEIRATVPRPFQLLSNGFLLDITEDVHTRTYHYLQDAPHSSYLVMLAAGEFTVVRDTALVGDTLRIPLEYWVYPERRDDVPRTFGRTPEMIRFFSEYLRVPYPWAKYAQITIQDFQFGGMENTSATTLTDATMIDERAALDYNPDGLIAHELAHQWFGDLVTTEYWNHIWLNESFATYFDALFTEFHRGKEAYTLKMWNNEQAYLREAHTAYMRPIVWNRWLYPINMFDSHSYPKGAWVLHMLRDRLGEEAFRRVLHTYLKTFGYGPVETHNLEDIIEATTGQYLDTFFKEWVYSAGHPMLDISYTFDEQQQALSLRITQKQAGFLVPEVFHIRLPMRIVTLEDTLLIEPTIDEREEVLHIPLTLAPEYISVDPENRILDESNVEQPVAAWITLLHDSPYPAARLHAAQVLRQKPRDEALLLALRDIYQKEKLPEVRLEILRTITTFPPSPSLKSALMAAMLDKEAPVRREALRALSMFEGDPEVMDLARLTAEQDLSYAVQAEAVRALARLKAPDAMDYVRAALITPSHREVIRVAALDALAILAPPYEEVQEILQTWLRPSHPTPVRVAAVRLLAHYAKDQPSAFKKLLELLSDPRYQVRSAAIQAIIEVSNPEGIPYLEQRIPVEPDGRLVAALYRAIHTLEASK